MERIQLRLCRLHRKLLSRQLEPTQRARHRVTLLQQLAALLLRRVERGRPRPIAGLQVVELRAHEPQLVRTLLVLRLLRTELLYLSLQLFDVLAVISKEPGNV